MFNSKPNASGVTDNPQGEKDLLKIDRYTKGLAGFIRNCETPLTISVQGSWGSGKTSMMLLVEDALDVTVKLSDFDVAADAVEMQARGLRNVDANKRPIYSIRFNTWQYSQFHFDSLLAFSMLQTIVAELGKLVPNGDSTKKIISKKLVRLIRTSLNVASNMFSASGQANAGTDILGSEDEESSGDLQASIGDLTALKSEIAALVAQIVGAGQGEQYPGRIVIFVDDLDRLPPHRAVELMETLKLFLDIEHCVFVLAIDFEVVEQGVMQKYGDHAGGQGLGKAKARSFFDKIIQVPFHMPVASFETDELLSESLSKAGVQLSEAQQITFKDLAETAVQKNPRSIKRLMNTFMLLLTIADDLEPSDYAQLFAMLCVQLAYPGIYVSLTQNEHANTARLLFQDPDAVQRVHVSLADADKVGTEEDVEEVLEAWDLSSARARSSFKKLARCIYRLFEIDGNELKQSAKSEANRDFDHEAFEAALNLSKIAGASQSTSDNGNEKIYSALERRAALSEEITNEDKLDQTLALPEQFVKIIESQEFAPGVRLRVGMQPGAKFDWTIESSGNGKRVGLIQVRQKFFHVYFGPRKWMSWNGAPVTDDGHRVNEYCQKEIRNSGMMADHANKWLDLFGERIDSSSLKG